MTAFEKVRSEPVRGGALALDDRIWSLAFYAVFGVAAVVCLVTFLDYGLTWDEPLNLEYAEGILRWYQSWGADRGGAFGFRALYLYGGSFDVGAQLVGRVFPAGVYEGRHFVNVLWGLAGVWGTWRLGRFLGGARAGFLAAVFLLLNPVYYGHSFYNPKDIPFAAASVWSLVAMFEATDDLPRIAWRRLVWTGLALGLVLGVRIGGVFHYGYLALLWGGGLLLRHLQVRWDVKDLSTALTRLLVGLLVVLLVSWAVMLVTWPYGLVSPVLNPLRALSLFHGLTGEAPQYQWDGNVLFNGRIVRSTAPPWDYLPVYFAVSLPEFYFVGFLCGATALAVALKRRLLTARTGLMLGMLVFITVFPVAAAMALGATLYDGLRHFLFLMPALAVLAAWGVSEAWGGLGRGRVVLAGLMLGLMGWLTVDMVQLHPYQSVYFNRMVAGGLRGAAGRFETDYWGLSYKEAAQWVMARYRPGTAEPIRVANCSMPALTEYLLEKAPEPRRVVGSTSEAANVFIATTRFGCHERSGRLLKIVERQGVGLAYVFEDRRPLP